jgi:hypothetical protein
MRRTGRLSRSIWIGTQKAMKMPINASTTPITPPKSIERRL